MPDRSHDLNSSKEAPRSAALPTVPNGRKAWVLGGTFLFLWAFWIGLSGWKNLPPKAESTTEHWQDKTIALRVAVLRQELAAIEARPIKTVDDYVSNTLETEPIVDEGKLLARKQLIMIARFKNNYQYDAGDVREADYATKLTEKDEQLMYLLGDEIHCAKDLQALPAARRIAYYKANVPPIKDKEAQVAKDWFVIANDARASGVPLPAYDSHSVSQPDMRRQP
jgi:hypothetical protein